MYLIQDRGVNPSFKFSVRRRKFTTEVTAAPPQSGAGESGAGRREQSGEWRERVSQRVDTEGRGSRVTQCDL